MFKRTGTQFDTQPTPTPMQQTLTCALKNAKLLLPQRFSSESTGDV
jgi:hypothetical protein